MLLQDRRCFSRDAAPPVDNGSENIEYKGFYCGGIHCL